MGGRRREQRKRGFSYYLSCDHFALEPSLTNYIVLSE